VLTCIHALFIAHKSRRQSLALRSLTRVPPSSREAEALHNFYLAYGQEGGEDMLQAGEERVWMGDTRQEVCQLMLPQQRK
jgi:acyl-coenzyme A thioesterase 9